MSTVYELIGRVVVWAVRRRYATQLKAAAAVAAASVAGAGYLLAKREPPEG
jgi:hypothetical protein